MVIPKELLFILLIAVLTGGYVIIDTPEDVPASEHSPVVVHQQNDGIEPAVPNREWPADIPSTYPVTESAMRKTVGPYEKAPSIIRNVPEECEGHKYFFAEHFGLDANEWPEHRELHRSAAERGLFCPLSKELGHHIHSSDDPEEIRAQHQELASAKTLMETVDEYQAVRVR